MKTIRYFKTTQGWHADFVEYKEVFEAFGTTILPLPFTSEASEKMVRDELAKRNPNCELILI